MKLRIRPFRPASSFCLAGLAVKLGPVNIPYTLTAHVPANTRLTWDEVLLIVAFNGEER